MRRNPDSAGPLLRRVLAAALAGLAVVFRPAWAGVSTPYGEIVVDNVPIGEEINMRQLASIAYRARNTGSVPVRMLLSVVGQDAGEYVKPGYEKIPALSWIRLGESEFQLAPGQEAVTDVYIAIPKDPAHLGRKYQAYIWARAIPLEEGSLSVVSGVKSRILLNVSRTPLTTAQRAQVKELKASLSFQLMPDKITVGPVALGQKVDLKQAFKKSLKLINPNDSGLKFKVAVVRRASTYIVLPEGWEDPPDLSWLKVEPGELSVEGDSIEELRLALTLPRDEAWRERKFIFVVEAVLQEFDVPVTYHARVFVETEGAAR